MGSEICIHELALEICALCNGSERKRARVSTSRSTRRPTQLRRLSGAGRDLIERRIDDVLKNIGDARLSAEVRRRVLRRLDGMVAGEEALVRRKVPATGFIGAVIPLATDLPELVILRAVALTDSDGQFGVTPAGEVFASSRRGYSREAERMYVTSVSPLLADIAYHFNLRRSGAGGRFYEKQSRVIDARTRAPFLDIVLTTPEGREYDVPGGSEPLG